VTVRRLGVVLVASAVLASTAGAAPAHASLGMQLGIFDDAQTLGDPATTFATLKKLHVQVVRITLDWRTVAPRRPTSPADPLDPAYNWTAYDTAVQTAARYGIKPLLTIWGTPAWANQGRPPNYPPTSMQSLYSFAYAAASRYSGNFIRGNGAPLAAVRLWLAWNEPNNPVELSPQFMRSHGKWVMAAPAIYAKICTAVYEAVHAAEENASVGCGATAPRGDNSPESTRPSISPLAFLRAVKAAGLRSFDAWAHHPYYGGPLETPATRPPAWQGAVELGNIGSLISELTRLYGPRRVWITEYGFQTNPPDRVFGVSWANQAHYLREAYAIAKANPRIDLFTWFPLRDNPNVSTGWQSGLLTDAGVPKPAFSVFEHLLG
jgi:hypothetical protein